VPVVPVGIDGPYQAWPRSHRLPRAGVIRVVVGDPIQPEDVVRWDDEQLLDKLQQSVQQCLEQARQSRQISRQVPVR